MTVKPANDHQPAVIVQPRFLTVAGAAAYCSLSQASLRREIAAGRLTAYRPRRGRILLDRRQLEALVTGSDQRPRTGRGLHRDTPARTLTNQNSAEQVQ